MNNADQPFGNCKNAPLHQIYQVQDHGVLIAVDVRSGLIEHCSENSADLLGAGPDQLLGQSAANCLPHWPDLSSLALHQDNPETRTIDGDTPLSVVIHHRDPYLILEFEAARPAACHWWNHSRRRLFLEGLAAIHTSEQCRKFLVDMVFEVSGFDRVMMYQFRPDWDGEVVYERCRPGFQGFLGLRFPASDIPANARQLFTLNWQRAIGDVDSAPVPIISSPRAASPLDLTYSTLRSAHPAHIQYLRNMGVQASQTLSVVVNGKLWALVACHHLCAGVLPAADRFALEEIARLVSIHLTTLLGLVEERAKSEMRRQLSRLEASLSSAQMDLPTALSQNLGAVRKMFGARGAWLRFDGDDFFSGLAPDGMSLVPLRDYLEQLPREEVTCYNSLPTPLHPHRALVVNASGILFVPLGSADFVVLLRPEVIETVKWAGKPAEETGALPTLTPRNSFAMWAQRVVNTAEPWSDIELEYAAALRMELRQFISNARLEQIAMRDPLTGLANRLLFERRLQQEVRNAVSCKSKFAVYMVDLDRFKHVNDTYGHAAGDKLLTEVGARLRSLMRPEDTIARLGGDEFALIQTDIESKASAGAVAESIVRAISAPYRIGDADVEVGASIGVSVCPSDTEKEAELLECADLALYQVKRSGRNAYSMYEPAMQIARTQGAKTEILLRALHDGEFRLVYQPIVDARSGKLRGLEAFMKWLRPGEEPLNAGRFIPLVEERRLGPLFGEWAMEAAFAQYQQWLRKGLPTVPLTLNIGNAEFETQDLMGLIEKMAGRYETGWHWLRLDIKEQALSANASQAVRKLTALHEAGIGANLDNFGSGSVPLGYLTELPFLGIKLEGSLLHGAKSNSRLNAFFKIVQSIALVFSAQLTVTRVETPQMRNLLKSQHVDLLQGYAIGAPAAAHRVEEWLQNPDGSFEADSGPLATGVDAIHSELSLQNSI